MKQNEAVRLALYILGGTNRLDKITLIALMLKEVDWSNAEEPDASIRRIVRNDAFITPVEGQKAWYTLCNDIPDELKAKSQLREDWLERILEYDKLRSRVQEYSELIQTKIKECDKLTQQAANSLSIDKVVDYSVNHHSSDQQYIIKLALYDLLGDHITAEQRKKMEPLGRKQATTNIQNTVYPQAGSIANIGTSIMDVRSFGAPTTDSAQVTEKSSVSNHNK